MQNWYAGKEIGAFTLVNGLNGSKSKSRLARLLLKNLALQVEVEPTTLRLTAKSHSVALHSPQVTP